MARDTIAAATVLSTPPEQAMMALPSMVFLISSTFSLTKASASNIPAQLL